MKEMKPGEVIVMHNPNPPVVIKGEMTLRDYFAAKAMQGLIERYDCELPSDVAMESYDYADAMLAARSSQVRTHTPDDINKVTKPWVGLTDEDRQIAFDDTQEGGGFWEFADAIEAKLKEKNG